MLVSVAVQFSLVPGVGTGYVSVQLPHSFSILHTISVIEGMGESLSVYGFFRNNGRGFIRFFSAQPRFRVCLN